ncbi:MAG TPA: cupredoxin family copper-binding protein [Caulobacteraceae bacterium]|jgi:plastocyanin|nr:cupredoxin family copper-binding protein [Caulobacteraceae bacterium]
MPKISNSKVLIRIALGASLAVGAATAVGVAIAGAAPGAKPVAIENFTFGPPVLTVAAGTTVTWTNEDDIPHTVRAVDNAFHSKAMDTADSYSFTFAKPGVYSYFCSLHPKMVGKVVVK